MKISITIVLLIVGLATVKAQSTRQSYSDSLRTTSQVRIGLRYTSDYLFMGRSDSAKAPYLTPSIGYYHKSGFSIRGQFSYLTAEGQGRIDMYAVTGGYDYVGEKLAWGASLTEYLFSSSSYVVRAEMSTYLNAYAGYDFNAFMVYADAGLGFSDGADFFMSLDISRMFFLVRNKFIITPSLAANAGTQRYYDQYYQYRSPQSGFGQGGSGKGKNGQQQPAPVVGTLESDKFQLLDYETSLQVTYRLSHTVRFFSTATWTFPVNPATVIVNEVPEEENLQKGFFWTAGVRFTLRGR
jgi:hypothetical protein